ncbi:hypothetical protein PFICI_14608 [Pestalotiopsis fici W106-1]|uniref:LYR motif-containing protein Cup1-like N-terminal domain-containing protein n=1 Tax=Pestalotiopsis fici (strain W106-1 / CGMCC3.15140) TaxID=1229662 RepID=W3WKG6_PESFW|nr:uncharacterized protein PFICI_14608 [Pestalotiopsis fici W106-1]ETS73662.1 hypothetical protein PFICI_14608 [Pestalotiopsis fici W106-1]
MPLQIPHPNTALHLYRHLLREATYLPPLARPWTYSQIQSRFRDRQHPETPKKRYIQSAHRSLRYLRSANAGHADRMLRICFLATGRLGKRRRLLSSTYLSTPPPEDSAALEDTTDQNSSASSDALPRLELAAWGTAPNEAHIPKKKGFKKVLPATCSPSWMENWDLVKVKALAQSQYLQQEATVDWVAKNKIRRTIDPKMTVVTENCWGLPLKPRQMTNRLQKHWKSVLSSVMAPLPQEEWDLLKAVVEGTAPKSMHSVPKRRPVAVSLLADAQNATSSTGKNQGIWDWEKHATTPIRKLERHNSRRKMALSGSMPEHPQFQDHPVDVRTLTPSFLRSAIYSKVWQLSPAMEKNAKGKWTVTWGSEPMPKPSTAKASHARFFQGVDTNGKVVG